MTTTSCDPLICECGHEGMLRTRENDQPFSGNWSSHKLEGFEGRVGDGYNLDGLRCLACGKTGNIDFKKQ